MKHLHALWITVMMTSLSNSIPAGAAAEAILRVRAGEPSSHPVPAFLTGKFTEHLGRNIYHGIDAQILLNPTFAVYPFATGQQTPDGAVTFHWREEEIRADMGRMARRAGWPDEAQDALLRDYRDGLAFGWTRVGPADRVRVSPDTAPYGQRAQRVELSDAGLGIAQWTYLPLHRVRSYAFACYLRSPEISGFTLTLAAAGDSTPCGQARVDGVTAGWQVLRGTIDVAPGTDADALYQCALTADTPGQFVIGHMFLWPADHVGGADPDVVRLLRESRLPIHRWPGGNFVSGYHWEDGIGPVEQRPTRPNPAWGGVEPNTFGTDEFIALCREIGCEPMICVNAGDGTPAEAARWIEYCNGAADTPMGRLRAANGHPEPYRVAHWEIGNELWGRWQVHWTTGTGYADRFRQFREAMLAADPTVVLYACGAPVHWGKDWNDALIAGAASILETTTDHPLIGGGVNSQADPLDVFCDFMAVPDMLERKWVALRDQMHAAGVAQPRLAVTELQMFARINAPADGDAPARLTQDNLVHPGTLGEALYDVLFYHAALRLAPFVSMVTHSATVNHGGGLRKQRERVYPNPCHHAQSAFAEFAGAMPVAVEVEAPEQKTALVLPDVQDALRGIAYSTVDAVAAIAPDGALLISIVHRARAGDTRLDVQLVDFDAGETAQVRTLSADAPWAENSREQPDAVRPRDTEARVEGGRLQLDLPPYSVLRVRVPRAAGQ